MGVLVILHVYTMFWPMLTMDMTECVRARACVCVCVCVCESAVSYTHLTLTTS